MTSDANRGALPVSPATSSPSEPRLFREALPSLARRGRSRLRDNIILLSPSPAHHHHQSASIHRTSHRLTDHKVNQEPGTRSISTETCCFVSFCFSYLHYYVSAFTFHFSPHCISVYLVYLDCNLYPVSWVLSFILYLVSCTLYLVSRIIYLVSCILYLVSHISSHIELFQAVAY